LQIAHFDDVTNFPDGINTQIGERGMSLSGGQRQRLSIARALIARPSLLILDDAFSAIDSKTTEKIIQSFKEASHKEGYTFFDTLLVVTHKPSIAKEMDRIIVLEDGKICEQGCHYELMQRGGWYANEFSTQEEGAV